MWDVLPNEIIYLILQFLDLPDLKRARLGSKKLNSLVSRRLKYQWTKGKDIFKFPDAITDYKTILIDKSRILIIFKPSPYFGSNLSSDLYLYIYNVETDNAVKVANLSFEYRNRCKVNIKSSFYYNDKLYFFIHFFDGEFWELYCYDFKKKSTEKNLIILKKADAVL